jgi:nitroimidazol reductase NimA-like FMN-containing flavoprotein (pyridoxamine 5'-phosphate oxidase superfamily)
MNARHVVLMRHEAMELLWRHDVGRLCVLDGEYPIAVPVNYRMHNDGGDQVVVIQTAPTTAIARSTGNASLEVDEIDLAAGAAWSVIARGLLKRAHGDHGLPSTDPVVAVDRDQWLTLEIVAVSGRRFSVAPRRPPAG